MDQTSILQEMIQNNEACRITQNEDVQIVNVRPQVVFDKLKDKLMDDDLQFIKGLSKKMISHSLLVSNLQCLCADANCTNKESRFRAIPNGNINSKIMFVNKAPSLYESYLSMSYIGEIGLLLSVILSKLNINRQDVYCTDIIKCHTESLDSPSCAECTNRYFAKEIRIIKPQLIVFNGLSAIDMCLKLGILNGLPDKLAYGNIYKATMDSLETNVMAMYDLNKVLQKTGEDYIACKNQLWNQLNTAINFIN